MGRPVLIKLIKYYGRRFTHIITAMATSSRGRRDKQQRQEVDERNNNVDER